MDEHVYPNEAEFHRQVAEGDRWQPTLIVETLKAQARAAGLWNLFLPASEYGAGLTNLQYAPLCESMGRSIPMATSGGSPAPAIRAARLRFSWGRPIRGRPRISSSR